MTALEMCLIAVGIIAIAVSYFISEKNAEERMKKAVDELILSEETKRTLIKQAKDTVEEALNGMSEEIEGKAEVQLEKLSNEKIMMVKEYTDTVLEEIEKNHHEVMFLYSMLDDKDKDIKNAVRDAQKIEKTIHELNQKQEFVIEQAKALIEQCIEQEKNLERVIEEQNQADKNTILIFEPDQKYETYFKTEEKLETEITQEKKHKVRQRKQNLEEYLRRNPEKLSELRQIRRSRKKIKEKKEENSNQISKREEVIVEQNEDKKRDTIIELYQQGNSSLEIARKMGLSMGEVKLMIDLYYVSNKSKGTIE